MTQIVYGERVAVYTHITQETLTDFLFHYDIGELVSFKGITEGIENTNYLLVTTVGKYILTLYERRVTETELPFFLGLKQHLAQKHFSCPLPVAAKNGALWQKCEGKNAAIVTFVNGKSIYAIRPNHCFALGQIMAQMHLAAADFPLSRANGFAMESWESIATPLYDEADEMRTGFSAYIKKSLEDIRAEWPTDLPQGITHADMFPDNVLFDGDKIGAVIDFYYACNDMLVYDLAICLNSWCFETMGEFNITKAQQLLRGYDSVRPLSQEERQALPILVRGSALRFMLTRLRDWIHRVDHALVVPKDPFEYLMKLRFHQQVNHVSAYGL